MITNKFKTILGVLLLCVGSSVYAQSFKVVLDPGHGGKDPGAKYGNFIEKDIVLDVALKVGKLLKADKDIKVIYTRSTNREKADVFISIHANAAKNREAYGTETFIMGMSKNAANLEVAKRENAVITLENNYEKQYAGYDPNKPESLIGLTLLQEQFIKQSIDLASRVQKGFRDTVKRTDRGVKQGPFWVLHSALMPSVLIELGFVSNSSEGAYINSEEGKNELARAIAKAIVDYKKSNHSS